MQTFSSIFIPKAYIKTFYNHTFAMKNYHAHRNLEFMYLVSGQMIVEQPDGNSVFFKEQQLLLVRSNRPHMLKAVSDNIELLVFELTTPATELPPDEFIAKSPLFSDFPTLVNLLKNGADIQNFSDTENIKNTFLHLLDILSTHHDGVPYEFFELDYEITLKRLFMSIGLCQPNYIKIFDNRYINRALDFIRSNYSQDISADDIAKHLGVTQVYAQKLFHSAIGMSIMKTVNFYRLKQAEYLLCTGDYTMLSIARKTGFKTLNNFYRHFRSAHNCSPTEYRKDANQKSFYIYDPIDALRQARIPREKK